ncbi:MAG: ATP-binding protein [Candidatus Thorarchaeota archaeon]
MPVREIIEIDEEKCTGCGECIPNCAEGALQIINGKAKLIRDDLCDGLGACLGHCPEGALRIIHREAPEFDEEAVEEHLAKGRVHECPSCDVVVDGSTVETPSLLSGKVVPIGQRQWPIALRLVSTTAQFFKDADLLVAADCVPFSYPLFQQEFLPGKVLVYGCPKFDNAQGYVEKLTEIFQKNSIKSITMLKMEVPCCSGLQRIVEIALSQSGKQIPLENITITLKGNKKT